MKVRPASRARPGKARVLGEKAVARMDRLRARARRGLKDRIGAQIALARRRRPDPDRLVRQRHVARLAIGVGIDGDGADAEALQRADDAAGDLAAIGDQDRIEHRRQPNQPGVRFSRNAPTPSRASGVALNAAIRCAVWSINSALIGRPARSRISVLAAAIACRTALHELAHDALDRGIEPIVRDHLVDQTEARRLGRADSLAREHQSPRLARPHRREHVGSDHRGDQPETHLGRAEHRPLARHHDVTAGNQAGAAAERRAVHAGNGRLRELVQRLHQPGQGSGVGQVFCGVVGRGAAHPVEIRPGREAPAGAGQDHHAHRIVRAEARQLRGQQRRSAGRRTRCGSPGDPASARPRPPARRSTRNRDSVMSRPRSTRSDRPRRCR